jgi:acetyl/propionyl-CoA carboxylase alpha subunit
MEGMAISTHYDPMISKLITHAPTRNECIDLMAIALDDYVIKGSAAFAHNTSFLHELCRSERFRRGDTPTSFIPEEYPGGFKGVTLRRHEVLRAVAAAAVIHTHHQPLEEMVVTLGDDGHSQAMAVTGGPHSFHVTVTDEHLLVRPLGEPLEKPLELKMSYDWEAGSPLVEINCGDGHGLKVAG